MRIESGELQVLANGVVLSNGQRNVTFVLSDTPRMAVEVRVQKVDGAKPEIRTEVVDADTLAVVFVNPNALNFGSAEPVNVGTLDAKALSASLRINVFGDFSSYEVMYTFYLDTRGEV